MHGLPNLKMCMNLSRESRFGQNRGKKMSGILHEDLHIFYSFRRHKFNMKHFCATPNNFVLYTVTYSSTIHRANRCSFITTMVIRTRRNVTGYVYCLSCFLLRWTKLQRTWTSLTQKDMPKCALISVRNVFFLYQIEGTLTKTLGINGAHIQVDVALREYLCVCNLLTVRTLRNINTLFHSLGCLCQCT